METLGLLYINKHYKWTLFVWFANWKSASLSTKQLQTLIAWLEVRRKLAGSNTAAVISLVTLIEFSKSRED